MLTLGNVVHS